jgi:chromosome segregation ATPase
MENKKLSQKNDFVVSYEPTDDEIDEYIAWIEEQIKELKKEKEDVLKSYQAIKKLLDEKYELLRKLEKQLESDPDNEDLKKLIENIKKKIECLQEIIQGLKNRMQMLEMLIEEFERWIEDLKKRKKKNSEIRKQDLVFYNEMFTFLDRINSQEVLRVVDKKEIIRIRKKLAGKMKYLK